MLRASGFNAHGQLDASTTQDLRVFQTIALDRSAQVLSVLFACWSTTVFRSGDTVFATGFRNFEIVLDGGLAAQLTDAFGDEDGMIGCLDASGRVLLLEAGESEKEYCLLPQKMVSDVKVCLCAAAGNGRIGIVVERVQDEKLVYSILVFASVPDMSGWLRGTREVEPLLDWQHPHDAHSKPEQLIANTGVFLLLSADGEVFSWGDPRYRGLGRPASGDGADSTNSPGVIEALAGLSIRKLAGGGWLNAALSEDNALYLWGSGSPGADRAIQCLKNADPGEIVLVDIPDHDGEPLDIIDVAVGDAHLIALADDGRLFVVGDNANGQLGLGNDDSFVEDWTDIKAIGDVGALKCGPKSSFIAGQT